MTVNELIAELQAEAAKVRGEKVLDSERVVTL